MPAPSLARCHALGAQWRRCVRTARLPSGQSLHSSHRTADVHLPACRVQPPLRRWRQTRRLLDGMSVATSLRPKRAIQHERTKPLLAFDSCTPSSKRLRTSNYPVLNSPPAVTSMLDRFCKRSRIGWPKRSPVPCPRARSAKHWYMPRISGRRWFAMLRMAD